MNVFYSSETGGFYISNIHGSLVPADAVEITPAEHELLLHGQALGKRILPGADGRPMLSDHPLPSIDVLAARSETEVRQQSAAARNGWRTPGKDGVYRRKLDEAAAWRAAEEPTDLSPYPHLAAEVGITAVTAGELAALWEAVAAAWVQASAEIEAIEQRALKAIREAAAANDVAAVGKVPRDLVWPMPQA